MRSVIDLAIAFSIWAESRGVLGNGEYTCRTTDREYGHGVRCYELSYFRSSPMLFFKSSKFSPFSIL